MEINQDILKKATKKRGAYEELENYKRTCRLAMICPYCGKDIELVETNFSGLFGPTFAYMCKKCGEID